MTIQGHGDSAFKITWFKSLVKSIWQIDLHVHFVAYFVALALQSLLTSGTAAFLRQNGADDIKKHRWFKTIDWDAVPQRKLKVRFRLQEFPWHGLNSDALVFFFFSLCPATNWSSQNLALFPQPPIVPKVTHEGDTSNFDVYPEDDWKKDPPVPQKDLEIFENFWTPVSPLRHRTNECLADCRHNIVMVVLQELSLRAGKKQNPYLSKCVCVWGGQRPYSRPPQKKDTNNWYCDMYHIAEWFAFYIFIYDLSLCSFLYVFFNPAYAKKKKKSNHNNLVAFKT